MQHVSSDVIYHWSGTQYCQLTTFAKLFNLDIAQVQALRFILLLQLVLQTLIMIVVEFKRNGICLQRSSCWSRATQAAQATGAAGGLAMLTHSFLLCLLLKVPVPAFTVVFCGACCLPPKSFSKGNETFLLRLAMTA